MSAGRCAGCGVVDLSCRKVRRHVMGCPKYLELFRNDPASCLDPDDEYRRWRASEGSDDQLQEDKDSAREERLARRFADLDARREVQAARWAKPRSILDDEDEPAPELPQHLLQDRQ